MSADTLVLRATLEGHANWVTSIATTAENKNMILSASRGACGCARARARGGHARGMRVCALLLRLRVLFENGLVDARARACVRARARPVWGKPRAALACGGMGRRARAAPLKPPAALRPERARMDPHAGRRVLRCAAPLAARPLALRAGRRHLLGRPVCAHGARAAAAAAPGACARGGCGGAQGSWDGTLRLWDLTTGTTTRRFIGHKKDVLSVAFSVDNRQVRSD